MNRRLVALMLGLAAISTGCGSDDDAVDLPPAAIEGRNVMRTNGCAACHGSNGGGGVGPGFVGLYGSEVLLDDGTTVVADRDYLVESIVDPRAKVVDGYNLPMPTTELSDAEIDAVVAYIQFLAEDTA